MPAILATWEAKIRRTMIQGQLQAKTFARLQDSREKSWA
jgi:hypothetical protein